MKFDKFTKILLSSWLVLSCISPPLVVLAEGDATDGNSQTTSEPVAPPEVNQTTSATNEVDNTTITGDALAQNNTTAGDLSTGNASSISTVITTDNLANTPETKSYSLTPTPNVVGDITLAIPLQQDSVKPTIIPLVSDAESVTNTVTVSSLSGSATATDNTAVAQISTGDAYSNANVINILGSNVSAPDIFLGYITVKGNLTGDILLPSEILQSISSPSLSTAPILGYGQNSANSYTVNSSTDAASKSGGILASSNSKLGALVSGNATNMFNSLDLIGADIYGQTGLLVFVNVSGVWDGAILSQNPGVKAALIGSAGTNSSSYIIPLDTISAIELSNKIKISATSGDITAKGNTSAGDLTTGSATTVVNIANIIGSNIIFTKQFGALFITVLGNWYGSFGFDTPYGNPAPTATSQDPAPATSPTSSPVINSGLISIHHINTDNSDDTISSKTELSSYSYPVSERSPVNEKKSKGSLLDLLIWSIPLIGGSIALGLVNTDKKTAKFTKK